MKCRSCYDGKHICTDDECDCCGLSDEEREEEESRFK